MFFVRDSREYVKTHMLQVPKRDIMLEVGKMWNLVKSSIPCQGVQNMDYYREQARLDLDRFKREHAEYVSQINRLRHLNVLKSEHSEAAEQRQSVMKRKRTTLSDQKLSSFITDQKNSNQVE